MKKLAWLIEIMRLIARLRNKRLVGWRALPPVEQIHFTFGRLRTLTLGRNIKFRSNRNVRVLP